MKKYSPFFIAVPIIASSLHLCAGNNKLDRNQILEILTKSANAKSMTRKEISPTDASLHHKTTSGISQVPKSNKVAKINSTNKKNITDIVEENKEWEESGLILPKTKKKPIEKVVKKEKKKRLPYGELPSIPMTVKTSYGLSLSERFKRSGGNSFRIQKESGQESPVNRFF